MLKSATEIPEEVKARGKASEKPSFLGSRSQWFLWPWWHHPFQLEERRRGCKSGRNNVAPLPSSLPGAPLQIRAGLMQTHSKQSNTWCDSSRETDEWQVLRGHLFNEEPQERFPYRREFFSLTVTLPSPRIPSFDVHWFGIKPYTFRNCAPPNTIFCQILTNIPSVKEKKRFFS